MVTQGRHKKTGLTETSSRKASLILSAASWISPFPDSISSQTIAPPNWKQISRNLYKNLSHFKNWRIIIRWQVTYLFDIYLNLLVKLLRRKKFCKQNGSISIFVQKFGKLHFFRPPFLNLRIKFLSTLSASQRYVNTYCIDILEWWLSLYF